MAVEDVGDAVDPSNQRRGHVVLGYTLDPERRGLKVDPEEAKLVRLIFDLYLGSRSVGAVAQKLGALGYGQKRGGRSWTPGAVHTVLRNPLYAGKVRGKDGELHAGQHEPIVDLAVFEAAARSLSDRTSGRLRQSRADEYLLVGLLHCGDCGSRMGASMARGRRGRRYRYYRCQRHQERAASCPRGLLPADEVEQAVVAQVAAVARRDDVRREILERLSAEEGVAADLKARRQRLESCIAERNAEAQRLLANLGGTTRGGKLVAERLGELEAEMDRLRADLAELDARLEGVAEAARDRERTARLLESFAPVWDALLAPERRELLHLVVDRVTVGADGLRIALHELAAEPAGAREDQQ